MPQRLTKQVTTNSVNRCLFLTISEAMAAHIEPHPSKDTRWPTAR
jgi:hypothetical protein